MIRTLLNTAFPVLLLVVALSFGGSASAQDGPPQPGEGEVLSKLPGWLGGDQPEFFRLPPFNVPTIRERGVVGQIALNITIETLGLANKRKVIEKRVYIQSAFLRDLYGVASINNGSGKALNLDTVKRRLRIVADRLLGEGVVKDVLVENAYTRKFD